MIGAEAVATDSAISTSKICQVRFTQHPSGHANRKLCARARFELADTGTGIWELDPRGMEDRVGVAQGGLTHHQQRLRAYAGAGDQGWRGGKDRGQTGAAG